MMAISQRRIWRFVFALTVGMTLFAVISFPLNYLVPVFLISSLSGPLPGLSFRQGMAMIAVFIGACAVGLALTLLLRYPLVSLMITLFLLWHIFLFAARGGSSLVSLMMTICITVIPMAALENNALALLLAKSLCLAGSGTVLMIWLSFWLFPVSPDGRQRPDQARDAPPAPKEFSAIVSASIRMAMAAPAIALFFYAGLTGQLLTLVFICILLQTPDLHQGVKGGVMLLVANAAGGLVALMFYELLVAVPEWWALGLLTLLVSLLFSQGLFSARPTAPLYATALSTILLLIGSSTGTFGDEADAKFYARLFGIALAVLYLATAIIAARSILISFGKLSVKASPDTSAS